MRAPAVSPASMPRWADSTAPALAHSPHTFPVDNSINQRLAIWQGVPTLLEVDAVTNLSDELVIDLKSVSERVLAAAGPELREEIVTRAHEVRQGEVLVTPGFALPCRHILHIACPKYNAKQHQTTEAALQNCYNKVLLAAAEMGCCTVALCVPSPRHFPSDLASLQILRAIRKHLEQYSLPSLVIVAEPAAQIVESVTAAAGRVFPRDDTRIRIIHNPHEDHTNTADDDTSLCDDDAALEAAALFARAIQPDTQRLLAPRQPAAPDVACSQQQYERLLRRARTEDLSEVSGIGCLYQSGVDRLGRPVVIFIGKWFPILDIDLDKALLYLIKLLDPIVRGDYVIAYFHTLAASGNHPPFYWLKEVYTVLPYKYKKNLKAFYIVHPTFWTKMMTWWFTTFMAPAIKAKVHNLPGVEYLYSVMARDQLEVPAFVTEYDMTINGLHYFQPDTNNT